MSFTTRSYSSLFFVTKGRGRLRRFERLLRCLHRFVAYADRRLAVMWLVLHLFGHILIEPLARRRIAGP